MNGLNRIFLMGCLGTDPEAKLSKKGQSFVRLNLATNRGYKNQKGSWDEVTDWHKIYVWGKKADICRKHLKKGQQVMVEGYLSYYENADEEGNTRKAHSINALNLEFIPQNSANQA